jgi:hypothetical protein
LVGGSFNLYWHLKLSIYYEQFGSNLYSIKKAPFSARGYNC